MKVLSLLPVLALFAGLSAHAQLDAAHYTCVDKGGFNKTGEVWAVSKQTGQPVLTWKYKLNSAINGVRDAMQTCQTTLGIQLPGGHPVDPSSYACVVQKSFANPKTDKVCAVDQYGNCNFSWKFNEMIAGDEQFALNQCKLFRGETLPGSAKIDWSLYSCVDRGTNFNDICLRDQYGNCFQTWKYDRYSAINSKRDAQYSCDLFLSKQH